MSRNLTFFILGLTAAVVAYIFTPSLTAVVEMVVADRLPRDFLRLLDTNKLVVFGGAVSLFGLVFFLLYIIFPVTYVWYHINAARSVMAQLPPAIHPLKRTKKKTFLAQLKEFGFIGTLAESYGDYLVQRPEEKIDPALLKSGRLVKQLTKSAKGEEVIIAPVRAMAPAEVIFNRDSLIGENLLLDFFPLFARFLICIGVLCLGISVLSVSLAPENTEMNFVSAAQPGLIALLYCLAVAAVIGALGRFILLALDKSCAALARVINTLFQHQQWQTDLDKLGTGLLDQTLGDQLKTVLQKSLDKPMGEISKAVTALSVEQEGKLEGLLSKALSDFSQSMVKQVAGDATQLNKALKDAALAAEKMKKQQADGGVQFTKQMDKQAATIAKHLLEMQKNLKESEKTAQNNTDKMLTDFTKEVEKTYKNMSEFLDEGLQKLQEKQENFETAVSDKDSILQDLHATAKDLGTISTASGKLLDKFNLLTGEMDVILKSLQENGPRNGAEYSAKNNKLKDALFTLRQSNSEKTNELPDMD